MLGIIYSATNQIDGKIYIGKTIKGLEERKRNHFKCIKNPKTYFYRALKKYGNKNFVWEILEEIENNSLEILDNILNKYEKYYIECFDSSSGGYNGTLGGTGGLQTEQIRKKMSEKHIGLKNHLGFKNSPETIEKMRQAKLGKTLTEEHKRKIGIASRGKVHTEKTKKKISELKKGNTNFLGKHHTEESKIKMREIAIKNGNKPPSQKGKKHGTRVPNSHLQSSSQRSNA